MNGGTLRFMLEASGTIVAKIDGPPRSSDPNSSTLWVRLYLSGQQPLDLSIYSELDDDTTEWYPDAGKDCGLDRDDLVNLVLHCHGV